MEHRPKGKLKVTKLLEEDLCDIWLGEYFLDIKPIIWSEN